MAFPFRKPKRNKVSRKHREAGRRKKMFQVDPLEPRLLLSADPALGLGSTLFADELEAANNPQLATLPDLHDSDTANSEPVEPSGHIDFASYALGARAGLPTLTIDEDDTLYGSGDAAIELTNDGTVAPGYSPGIQNLATYTQGEDGTLEIEIAGTGEAGAVDGFDQLNVSGDANLGGKLDVKILEGYTPEVGDTFDFLTFDTLSGKFDELSGVFGFNGSYYFEVVQNANSLSLEVKALMDGSALGIEVPDEAAEISLGHFLNESYLQSGNVSITLAADIQVDEFVAVSGTFIFEQGEEEIILSAEDESVFYEIPDTYTASTYASDISTASSGILLNTMDFDNEGNLYVVASEDGLVYKIAPDGTKEIFVGSTTAGSGTLLATTDRLSHAMDYPVGLMFNADKSTLYVQDRDQDSLRSVDMATGVSTLLHDFTINDGFTRVLNSQGPNIIFVTEDEEVYLLTWQGAGAGDIWHYVPGESSATQLANNIGTTDGIYVYEGHIYVTISNSGKISKYDTAGNHVEDILTGLTDNRALTIDSQGRVLYTDNGSLKRLEANGSISVLAEGLADIRHISLQGDDIYLADSDNDEVIKLTLDAKYRDHDTWTHTVLSTAISTETTGTALYSIEAGPDGNLYVSAPTDRLVYKIFSDGSKSVFAGNTTTADPDSTGDKLDVSFDRQIGMAFSPDGKTLYLADTDNDTIRQIDMASGEMSTYIDLKATNGWDGTDTNGPMDLAVDASGDIYLTTSDTTSNHGDLYKIAAGSNVATLLAENIGNTRGISIHEGSLYIALMELSAGTGKLAKYALDGTFEEDLLTDMAYNWIAKFDSQGRLHYGESGAIYRIEADGSTTTIATGLGNTLRDLTFIGDDIYVIEQDGNRIHKFALDSRLIPNLGQYDDYGQVDFFVNVSVKSDQTKIDGIATDSEGNIYVSAPQDELIYRIAPDGTKEAFAGNDRSGSEWNDATGDKLDVSLEHQNGIAFNSDHSILYIADRYNDTIRQVDMATGIMSTFADFGSTMGWDGSNGSGPYHIAVADNGDVYFTSWNGEGGGDIYRVTDGTQPAELLQLNVGSLVEIDIYEGHIYVAVQASSGKVIKYDLEGNHVEDILTGVEQNRFARFDAQGRLHFMDGTDLNRLETEGSITTLATGLTSDYRNMAVDGDNIYLTDTTNDKVIQFSLDLPKTVTADVLSIAALDLNVFAGLNAGEDDAMGFDLSNAEFALSIFTDTEDPGREWTAFVADADSATLSGIPAFDFQATNVAIELNLAATDGSVVDFAAMEEEGVPFQVGTSEASSIAYNFDGDDGEFARVQSDIDIEVGEFFNLSGSFVAQRSKDTVILNDDDATEVEVDAISFGASDVTAFAGANGGTEDEMGFNIGGSSFALGIFSEREGDKRKWNAVQAEGGSASAVGFDPVDISASAIDVTVNSAADDGTVIDFAAMSAAGDAFSIATSSESSVELDIDGDQGALLQAAGTLEIGVSDFVYLQGDFAVRSSTETVTLNDEDATEVEVQSLAIGANGVDVFAGINRGESNEIGVNLDDGNLALAILSENAGDMRSWTALHAGFGGIELTGVPDVTLSGANLSASTNLAADDGTVVDFAAMDTAGSTFTVATGPATSVDFTMDGALGEMLQVAGTFEIGVDDFLYLQGDFAITPSPDTITLNDDNASQVEVETLAIGANGVDLFAGVNKDQANEVGLELTDGNLALALLSEKAGTQRKWTAL